MPGIEIRAFSDEHLDAAGSLLAARHRRHREAERLLPERYEKPGAARAEVEAAWRSDGASGAVALSRGDVVGYLIGAPRDDAVWGANTWVELAGHAVDEAEVLRDLYAAAAARWVEAGRTRHYALVPATEPALVEAWFRVGFGQQQAHGVRELPTDPRITIPDGFAIRPPDLADLEQLIELDVALPRHQQASPVFSSRPLPTPEECRQEWRATLSAGEEEILIGYHDGTPVACWSIVPIERSRDHRGVLGVENACYLGFAVTLPEYRGSGIGRALTEAAFARAAEQGFSAMTTDWRVTNLLASRYWPRRGFRTTFLRLYRSIP